MATALDSPVNVESSSLHHMRQDRNCSLPIIIVGAGITGLALAQYLKSANIPVQVFERDSSPTANPSGWGLTIHWALPALRKCLPDHLFMRLTQIQVDPELGKRDTGKFIVINLKTGAVAFEIPPNERIRIHRGRFRSLLSEGIDIQWNKSLVNFRTSPAGSEEWNDKGGVVHAEFQDGTQMIGSMLIGADGIGSPTRKLLLGQLAVLNELPVRLLGMTLRMTPEQVAPLRVIDPLLFQGCDPDTGTFLWYSTQSTPLTNGSLGENEYFEGQLIFSWVVKSASDEVPSDPRARLRKMKQLAQDLESSLKKVVDDIPDEKEPMSIVPRDWPTIQWNNRGGLVTLAGDAAHPMTMYRGEGANHALTDSAKLAEQLQLIYDGTLSKMEALANYESEILTRGHQAVLLSRQACFDAHDLQHLSPKSPLVSKRAIITTGSEMA